MRGRGVLLSFVVLLAPAISGCATLADFSSGEVGCSPEEIMVSDEQSTWSTMTWTAECNGREYHCSSHGGGEGSTAQVSCTRREESTVPGGTQPPPAAEARCQYDTQCKGERICEVGACVSPADSSSQPQS
jgi:hypothetical protein